VGRSAGFIQPGGVASPLFDASVCDDILADMRQPDGTLPDFGSIPSQSSSPPPQLEVARSNKTTQVDPTQYCDVGTQALSRPHQGTAGTQTSSIPTADISTQVLIRPPRSVAFTQTARPATSTTTSWTQTARPSLINTGTDMTPTQTTDTGCQVGAFYDTDVIPPGVPRPALPWGYTYGQFYRLLTTYPDLHPEDFVTFGIHQAQPRRGSFTEWREVAGVLSHMAGGQRSLAEELYLIIARIRRMDTTDPMRPVEEQALVHVIMRERQRSSAPRGDGAYATLAAPGGPMAYSAPPSDPRRPPQSSSAPLPRRHTSPPPSRGRGRRPYRASPGPTGTHGGPCRPPPGFVDLTEDTDEDMPHAMHLWTGMHLFIDTCLKHLYIFLC